ncbi:MAG: peptidylprolyl isomerase [Eubacteriales bacterium]|nr:peptidylprolyl isomerase [Eubacteriales bacterium]
MKKIVAGIAVLCLAFTGLFSYFQIRAKEQSSSEEDPYAAYEKALEEMPKIDYEALYASNPADVTVAVIDNKEITWGEYFQAYYGYSSEIEEYMKTMLMYYGSSPSWDDFYSESENLAFKDLPALYSEDDLKQKAVIDGFAEINGIELNEENKALVEEELKEARESYCGEGASEEDFELFLNEHYFNLDMYRKMTERNYLYQQMFTDLYGENGEKITDEDGTAYLKEKGYVSADHILFMTMDKGTGEELDEDTVREKKKQAEEVSSELKAIEDQEERVRRFKEYREQYNEDTGSSAYPDGYTFTSGMMVQEFETAVNELNEFDVSEPIKTSYGYHVIIRTPLDSNAIIDYSETGIPMTGKAMKANEEYGEKLQEYMEKMEITYTNGWEKPVVTDYLKTP